MERYKLQPSGSQYYVWDTLLNRPMGYPTQLHNASSLVKRFNEEEAIKKARQAALFQTAIKQGSAK